MPRTTSAKKALRQSDTRRTRNVRRKRSLRDAIKKLEKALAAKNKIEAEKLYRTAQKAIDKSAKNGILKKNTASRMKSRLSSALKKLG
ncbi:MAG TPA: 30S ribosomal protein S20 [Candidatus Paceibacterota bacterium]|uniref:Small ribosomal subunit protein bS20 n=1 Tax=Candidatus Giovannonibacteria bacterium RIFCSPLOWO2_01_FULL_46_32 TaxID=1798353 RepID=A0A1F5XF53_9BACT|nr:MAG: 30S ribosomal protein S20 [Candidatus Giovannonibacteria bacterium RIFCSPLOWO2_01_FULL_46_32]